MTKGFYTNMILPVFIVFLLGSSSAIASEDCHHGPIYFDKPSGDIYSPGYKEGKNYPNDVYCEYIIRSQSEGYRIKITFKDIDVEFNHDFLEVWDVGGKEEIIGRYCGNETIRPLLSKTNKVSIKFIADDIGTRRGFHIQYHASNTKSLCNEGEKLCRNRNCYLEENKCDGVDDCGDGTDEEKCDFPLSVIECGKREIFETFGRDRIIGSNEAIPGSWPWQVSLQMDALFPCGHICGGTLINAQWVLTASHCIPGSGDPSVWRVHLGKHLTYKIGEAEQVRYVERIIVYPGITGEELIEKQSSDMTNDYTLMKLNAPVKFTKEVRPACLPEQDFELPPGKVCWTSGWGETRGTGFDYALKELNYTVQDSRECSREAHTRILPTMICTKNDKKFLDACHGDSGGPFVCEFNGKWYVNGATSFGTFGDGDGRGFCAMPENYAIFAKVSKKVNWILEQINKYS